MSPSILCVPQCQLILVTFERCLWRTTYQKVCNLPETLHFHPLLFCREWWKWIIHTEYIGTFYAKYDCACLCVFLVSVVSWRLHVTAKDFFSVVHKQILQFKLLPFVFSSEENAQEKWHLWTRWWNVELQPAVKINVKSIFNHFHVFGITSKSFCTHLHIVKKLWSWLNPYHDQMQCC